MTPASIGHIYVLKFSNGTVKVGSSTSPDKRLRQHQSDALAYGITLIDQWVSEPHKDYLVSEQTLISYARGRRGIRFRNEYFQHVRFDDVCGAADRIARGLAVEINGPRFFTVAEVVAKHPQFNRKALHWACVRGQVPYEVQRYRMMIAADDVEELASRYPDGGPFSRYKIDDWEAIFLPESERRSRSVRWRQSKQSAA